MKKSNKYGIAAVGVLLIVILGVIGLRRSQARDEGVEESTFEVRRGPLTISVVESGTIKAREQIIIKNKVEGRTSIIFLIPEGTRVQEGELLVELDASALQDSKIDQEIQVKNKEAAYINSKESLAVVESQAQSDTDLASLTLQFAQQDLKKYLEGDYPNEIKKADADITLAEEELTRAQQTLKWSNTLFEEKYISQTELQADQLAEKKRDLDLKLARNNRDLLTNFTYERKLAQLKSDVRQATMAMERVTRKAKANVVQAEADLRAKDAEFQRQQDKLKKILTQITNTKIFAPANGLVIYATSAQTGGFRGSVQPLDEGQDVRERQELIYLPTASSSKAEIAVHEANLQKIHVGLPAVITVDSLPGQSFRGEVVHVAPLPDAQSVWMNPDLKVFTTEINLEDNDELRSGMSCQAEIIVETHDEALYVPIQAVLRINGIPTVYVQEGKKWQPREIRTGLDNNVMIHVQEGLNDGDVVLLTPPLKAGTASHEKGDQKNKGADEQGKKNEPETKPGVKKTPDMKPGQVSPDLTSKTQGEKRPDRIDNQAADPGRTTATGEKSSDVKSSETPSEVSPDDRGKQERRRRSDNLTPEQRAERRKRFENLTPEQREEMRKRFENMTPEQREEMRKQMEARPPQDGPDTKKPPGGENIPKDSDKTGEKPAVPEAGK